MQGALGHCVVVKLVGKMPEDRAAKRQVAQVILERGKQAVCSPYRKALVRALARAAGVDDPGLRWRFAGGPYYDNQIATLSLEGREASLTISKTVRDEAGPRLETAFERRIA
jgi:hypothetical protein